VVDHDSGRDDVANLTTRAINGKLRTDAFGKGNGVYDTDNYYRPMAGLKSISSRITGNDKAIKQVDVSWKCWDFETLKKLTPFFLHPGSSVAIEFGWMWPGHKPAEMLYENWSTLDAKSIGNLSEANQEMGRGNQELLHGVIGNFTWEGTDDGGFDCKTTFTSQATNIFGEPLGDSEALEKFELSEDLKNQIRDVGRKVWTGRDSETDQIHSQLSSQGLTTDAKAVSDPTFIVNIPSRLFFEGLRETLLDMALYYDDGGYTQNDVYRDTIITEVGAGKGTHWSDSFMGPWISWGWFEDNILSRFTGKVNNDNLKNLTNIVRSCEPDPGCLDENGDKYCQSVKIRNDKDSLFTMNANEVIIPGQFPFALDFEEVKKVKEKDFTKLAGEKGQVGYARLSGQRLQWSKIAHRVAALPAFAVGVSPKERIAGETTDITRVSIDGKIEEFEKFERLTELKRGAVLMDEAEDKREFGYLRNLLINVEMIQEEMVRANTLEDGLKSLLSRISSACGGIWEFELRTNRNGTGLQVIELGSNETPVRKLLQNASANLDTGDPINHYGNNGLLVFPTWRTNSIVHSQQMVTKIPTGMQAQVVYGKNRSWLEAGVGNLSTTEHQKGKAIGKLFGIFNENQEQMLSDKIFENQERILGNSKCAFFGNNDTYLEGYASPEIHNPKNSVFIDIVAMMERYSKKQIRDILDDGIDYDENIKTETYTVNRKSGLDYQYLYNTNGIMGKQYKNAMMYFLKNHPASIMATNDVLVPIDLELTIDGTGGIYAGQCFTSTHIPARYRQAVVFQIMDVSHNIDDGGWKTTLRGMMRIDYGVGLKETDVTKFNLLYNEIKGKEGTNKPPYLTFAEYLTATAGKHSDYAFDLNKELESQNVKPIEEVDRGAEYRRIHGRDPNSRDVRRPDRGYSKDRLGHQTERENEPGRKQRNKNQADRKAAADRTRVQHRGVRIVPGRGTGRPGPRG
jgi:hypothetical protein